MIELVKNTQKMKVHNEVQAAALINDGWKEAKGQNANSSGFSGTNGSAGIDSGESEKTAKNK